MDPALAGRRHGGEGSGVDEEAENEVVDIVVEVPELDGVAEALDFGRPPWQPVFHVRMPASPHRPAIVATRRLAAAAAAGPGPRDATHVAGRLHLCRAVRDGLGCVACSMCARGNANRVGGGDMRAARECGGGSAAAGATAAAAATGGGAAASSPAACDDIDPMCAPSAAATGDTGSGTAIGLTASDVAAAVSRRAMLMGGAAAGTTGSLRAAGSDRPPLYLVARPFLALALYHVSWGIVPPRQQHPRRGQPAGPAR